jgi:Tfp pilus assembly protein PilF
VLGQDSHYHITKEDVTKSEEMLKRAIDLDPQFARAYFGLGHVYNTQAYYGWGNDTPQVLFERARVTLLKAISLESIRDHSVC